MGGGRSKSRKISGSAAVQAGWLAKSTSASRTSLRLSSQKAGAPTTKTCARCAALLSEKPCSTPPNPWKNSQKCRNYSQTKTPRSSATTTDRTSMSTNLLEPWSASQRKKRKTTRKIQTPSSLHHNHTRPTPSCPSRLPSPAQQHHQSAFPSARTAASLSTFPAWHAQRPG